MDNERPIEKLLRDYAKKRRADAGTPLEMHPATRRMLQGEVARQFPKAKPGGSSLLNFLGRWRPGLVYGVCGLVVIAISVPLLLPVFRNASSESQLANIRPEEAAAEKKLPPDAPTLAAAPALREADEKRSTERSNESGQAALAFTDTTQAKDNASNFRLEEEKQKSRQAGKFTTDAPVRSAPAVPAPAPQIASRDQAALDARSRMEQPARENRPDDAGKLALQTRRTVAEPPAAVAGEKLDASRTAQPPKATESTAGVAIAARSPGVAPTPSAAAPGLTDSTEVAAFSARYGLAKNAAVAVVQKFAQTQASGISHRSDATATSPVLVTFQLEQAGDRLRVIDSDGSTYTGVITPPAADAYRETKVELKGGPVKPGERTATQAVSTAAEFNYQAGQNYLFRVTGTNRTLRQPVIFAGNLLISTNAPTAGQTVVAQPPVGRTQNQPASTQNQLPGLLNSSITGKVQLGTNKEMQINAVPVNP